MNLDYLFNEINRVEAGKDVCFLSLERKIKKLEIANIVLAFGFFFDFILCLV